MNRHKANIKPNTFDGSYSTATTDVVSRCWGSPRLGLEANGNWILELDSGTVQEHMN